MANVEYVKVAVNLARGEHMTDELRKLNPSNKVPAMIETRSDNSTFPMFESHAIMKYLCYSRDLPESFYPRKPENLEL